MSADGNFSLDKGYAENQEPHFVNGWFMQNGLKINYMCVVMKEHDTQLTDVAGFGKSGFGCSKINLSIVGISLLTGFVDNKDIFKIPRQTLR